MYILSEGNDQELIETNMTVKQNLKTWILTIPTSTTKFCETFDFFENIKHKYLPGKHKLKK